MRGRDTMGISAHRRSDRSFGRACRAIVAMGVFVGAAALQSAAFGASGGAGGVQPAAPAEADTFATVDHSNASAPDASYTSLRAEAGQHGQVRVVVGLRMQFKPEGALSAAGTQAQHGNIRGATQRVLDAVRGTDHTVTRTYETVPYVALALSPNALNRLQASGQAATIQRDDLASPSLAESTVLVESTETAQIGRS